MILPEDDKKMSKRVGVQIIHCCNIYVYDNNCAFVSYNKKNCMSIFILFITITSFAHISPVLERHP